MWVRVQLQSLELQVFLRCCLIHIDITILRHFLYLLYLCPCLDLGPFISYLYGLCFIFIFIFILINPIIPWIQTHLFFCSLFYDLRYYLWMITWMKNEQFPNVQGAAWHLLDFLPILAWSCSKKFAYKKTCKLLSFNLLWYISH